MSKESLDKISDSLEKLVRIASINAIKELSEEDQPIKILRLKSFGLNTSEISELLGITANNINVTLHRAKGRKKKKKSKK